MLILNEETLARSNAALDRGFSGEIGIEEAAAEALAIEPRNTPVHTSLGMRRMHTDPVGAAECFWRGIRETPTRAMHYLLLGATCHNDDELAHALLILSIKAASVVQEVPEGMRDLLPKLYPRFTELHFDVSNPEMLGVIASAWQSKAAETEPARVTELLLPYRWLLNLCGDGSDGNAADLIREGREHAAPYAALLQAAIGDALNYEKGIHNVALCRLIALLGELGNEDALAGLAELAGMDDLNRAVHAQWAIWRMGQRFPQAVATVLAQESCLTEPFWADTVDQLYMLPAGTDISLPASRLIERIRLDLDSPDSAYTLAVLERALTKHGDGSQLMEKVRGLAKRLPRDLRPEREQILRADPFETQLVIHGEGDLDVLDVVNGQLYDDTWDDIPGEDEFPDDEDEFPFDDDGFDPDTALAIPAPPAPKVGRNDPCWCGSGKKYKKCHLEEDEERARHGHVTSAQNRAHAPQPTHLRLRDRMLEEISLSAGKKHMVSAFELYFGADSAPSQMNETDESCFVDWLLFNSRLPSGKTPCQDYRDRHRGRLTTAELAQLDAWIRARYGMWEVLRVDAGAGLQLKNMATEEELFVSDIATTKQLVRWDIILQRVEQHDGKYMFVGHGYTVPRHLLPRLWEWIDASRKRTGQTRADAILASSHELHRVVNALNEEAMRSLRLENFDGDPLELGEAAYAAKDAGALQSLLRAQPDVTESQDEGEPFFRRILPNKRDHDDTTVATIAFEGQKLLLRCNSRKRLRTHRKWLEKLAGPGLVHLSDTFQSTEEAREQAMKNLKSAPQPREPEIPEEQMRQIAERFQEEHYAKWIDMELPVLQGQTPRQASLSQAGRAALEGLLRDMENNEARRRRDTGIGYDFSTIRKQLKLAE